MRRSGLLLLYVILFLPTTPLAARQSAGQLALSTGAFAIVDKENTIEFGVEFRSGKKLGYFTPVLGMQMTSNGAVYTFSGFNYDIYTRGHFAVTPSFAAGVYARGEGKNLGGVIEFRSGLELSWVSGKSMRVSLAVHHISNAGIYSYNPGAESVVLKFAQPLHF